MDVAGPARAKLTAPIILPSVKDDDSGSEASSTVTNPPKAPRKRRGSVSSLELDAFFAK